MPAYVLPGALGSTGRACETVTLSGAEALHAAVMCAS